MSALTEAETNELLERFDQTEIRLQRQIVARFAVMVAELQGQNAALRAALERWQKSPEAGFAVGGRCSNEDGCGCVWCQGDAALRL